MTTKVSVELHIEQVRDGSHYNGYMKIASTKLDYELVFGVPIAQLGSMEPAKDESEIRRLFQITVKRDATNVELTKEEYGFFFQMLVTLAMDFYSNPQTRDSQEGMIGLILNGRGLMAGFGVSASIGMTSKGSYNFPPEICEMLSAPKFGCALLA
ncbi:MAG: hypothetical protein IPJ67_04380 [Candidatus Moraniibacteriota bacterium]|nr:MAG: hypothetical protein IPJ67_04380 [Candidatus Moranbacteria bacterium]